MILSKRKIKEYLSPSIHLVFFHSTDKFEKVGISKYLCMERIEQRTVTLQRKQGERFGFRLHCVNANDDLDTVYEITDVEENGHAYRASLRDEDRLIEVR